jgi:hypothetical protein
MALLIFFYIFNCFLQINEVLNYYLQVKSIPVHSINLWTVKIKIAVVRLVKSLVIFILPSCYL